MGLHPHSNTEFIAQKETLACFSIAVQKKAYISRHHKHLSKHLATDLIKNALMLLTQFTLKHYISNTIVFWNDYKIPDKSFDVLFRVN